MSARSWYSSRLMFAWLTIGYGIIHFLVAMWVGSILQQMFPGTTPIESIVITNDGEALIQAYAPNYANVQFRRLDGSVVTERSGLGKSFLQPTSYIWLTPTQSSATWNSRVTGLYDFQKPSTYWYLIALPDRRSTAYLVGFDRLSQRRVGYIGLDGFSLMEPTIEQSFPLPDGPFLGFQGIIASGQATGPYEPASDSMELQTAPMANAGLDVVWILSRGSIYEIQLGVRTVKKVLDNHPELRFLVQGLVSRDEKNFLQLLARTTDGLLTIDPKTGETQFAALEHPPIGFNEVLYEVPKHGRVIVQSNRTSGHGPKQDVRVIWMDQDGRLTRQQDTETFKYAAPLERYFNWSISICCPIPLVSVGACVCAPAFLPPEANLTYLDRSWKLLNELKFWIMSTLILGLASGWCCRRRQRDVFGVTNWFWPILVGSCGLFGWIGYICVFPLPAWLPGGTWLPSKPEPARPQAVEIYV